MYRINQDIFNNCLNTYAKENGYHYIRREGDNLTLGGETLIDGEGLTVLSLSDKADIRKPKGWFDFFDCYVSEKWRKGDKIYLTLAIGSHEYADPSQYLVLAKRIQEDKHL